MERKSELQLTYVPVCMYSIVTFQNKINITISKVFFGSPGVKIFLDYNYRSIIFGGVVSDEGEWRVLRKERPKP